MAYWQKPPVEREQMVLFAPTLEDRIPEDHPVRLLDEILASFDWSEWEAEYHGHRGQPPIHPRVLAGILLYGFTRGIRSSRQLEYQVRHGIDFLWLVEGRSIDHSTVCEFRTKFKQPLKSLYRHICRVAMSLGLARLCEVALDGTRVRASNGRMNTLTAEKIEKLLAQLDQQLEDTLSQAEQQDADDADSGSSDAPADKLPAELADLKARRQRLKEQLQQAQAADKARRREGIDPEKNPAQIPAADPDSRVLPNKEGGYAPNYTPMAMTDVHGGFIVATDVLASTAEHSVTLSMLDDLQEMFGDQPEAVLADGVYATGENLEELEQRSVELFSPLAGQQAVPDNPAVRDDPTVPVAEADYDRLPRNPQSKQLDKAAFVYVEDEDRYYCPQGRPLDYEQTKSETRREQWIVRRVYRSLDCSDCPLSAACRSPKASKNRSVSRDVHEKRRQAHAEKMATAEARARYEKRFHAAEVPFAILKQVMNLRRFLLRGLEKVRTEWLWGCTAYNLAKLTRHVLRLRATFEALAFAEAR